MRRWAILLLLSTASGGTAAHQSTAAANGATPPGSDTNAEMSTHDETATFRSRVDLVMVPVVVRDPQGHGIGTLRKEDFQLFDKGKPQTITKFSIEKPSDARVPLMQADQAANALEDKTVSAKELVLPEHYTAYVFDDVHVNFGDLSQVRDAAIRHMNEALGPADRAAIYTTSGQTTLEFTGDKEKLRETLLKLRPRPIARANTQQCPDISYFMADSIVNKNDSTALQAATVEAITCLQLPPGESSTRTAQNQAQAMASMALHAGEHEARVSLGVLKQIVGRLATMPGQRSIVLVSPGFFTTDDMRTDETEVMERAIRFKVIINSLNARGLYTIDLAGDISERTVNLQAQQMKQQYIRESALADDSLLSELAAGTGGQTFENNNDFLGGFRKLGSTPEFIYLLGFSPEKMKLDGTFHALKVKLLKTDVKYEVQARKGYYAPKHLLNEDERKKEELQDALFSRDEVHDLPVELHTQFFKSGDVTASLAVLARVNLRELRFRKADGRNNNVLTIVSGLFDRDGNFVKAQEKTITMRLRDETLTKTPAITLKDSFDVAPGTYVVRLVVRDAEGQMITAETSAVEIPY